MPPVTERPLLFIAGEFVQPSSRQVIAVISPSTEQPIGHVVDADDTDVDRAVAAARRSFDAGVWRNLPLEQRLEIIERAVSHFAARAKEIGFLMTTEMGMPISVSEASPLGSAAYARTLMNLARSLPEYEVRTGAATAAIVREPVGVVAAIAPWNGPFGLAVTKTVPALIAGCSIVFKPAPESPLSVFVLAEALAEAGLPAGVFNVITGGRETGATLVAHPQVDKVSFTGSTAAGRLIGEECGRSFKRMQLELGGKSAAIVLDDADLAASAPGFAMGCFFNTGQVCALYSRVLAPRSRYDEVVDTLCNVAKGFRIGDPFDRETTMGPVVSQRQRDRIEQYIASGLDQGAKLVLGGQRPAGLEHGWYVEPTVFANVDNAMKIAQEEIFGPVISVIPYDSVDEAITIANDSPYGLHGAVFTTDEERALSVARRVRTGTFSVNAFVYNREAPFGGVKCSGVGRDTGLEGLQSFYELKTINITPGMVGLVS